MSDQSFASGAGKVIRHREVGRCGFGVFASGARIRVFVSATGGAAPNQAKTATASRAQLLKRSSAVSRYAAVAGDLRAAFAAFSAGSADDGIVPRERQIDHDDVQ